MNQMSSIFFEPLFLHPFTLFTGRSVLFTMWRQWALPPNT